MKTVQNDGFWGYLSKEMVNILLSSKYGCIRWSINPDLAVYNYVMWVRNENQYRLHSFVSANVDSSSGHIQEPFLELIRQNLTHTVTR